MPGRTGSKSEAVVVELPSDREIVMTRVINAPRRLVFEAVSKCEHLKHWWGPRRHTMSSCELDFRPGGKWRFVLKGPNGREYGFRGEIREIVPPERVVQTFEFEGLPGHISVDTLTLTEKDGKTTWHARSVYASVEDRDGMLTSGMEEGANETMDRLDEFLAKMPATSAR